MRPVPSTCCAGTPPPPGSLASNPILRRTILRHDEYRKRLAFLSWDSSQQTTVRAWFDTKPSANGNLSKHLGVTDIRCQLTTPQCVAPVIKKRTGRAWLGSPATAGGVTGRSDRQFVAGEVTANFREYQSSP